MNKHLALFALLALSTSALAASSNDGWYAGVSLGASNTQSPSNIAGWTSSNNAVYGALAGYQFNPNFAIEGAYTGAGKFSNAYVNGKSDILTLDLLGKVEIMPAFDLYGKLGVGSATSKSVNGLGYAGTTHTGATYGLGIQYNVNTAWSARLGYDYYQSAINTPAGGSNFSANVVSLAALYHF